MGPTKGALGMIEGGRESGCTPDDRSGSMANFRRTQSQNRLAEGRVCFVVRAGHGGY